jgi:16S rRNA (cytosine967-C5)-methyltransferase
MINTRAIAAKLLAGVVRDKRSLSEMLQSIPSQLTDRDRGLVKEYGYGVLRWYHRLKVIADQLVYKPVKMREQEVASLLLIGLYQLIYLNTPSHAAVSETVTAAQILKKSWAKGLINQALHQFIKRKDFFLAEADATEPGKFSHPQWLIDALKAAWPEQWQSILIENNRQAPMFLRVNLAKISREAYQETLQRHQINAAPIKNLPAALHLEQPRAVENLPGFSEGYCSVQDLASQYTIGLLDLHSGLRILDACAAPGGKTSYILETASDLEELVAIDQDAQRLQRIEENILRLQLPKSALKLLTTDAANPEHWWDGRPFDRILLDAPCSGLGVIRRHPDIKILRQPEDMPAYARQQAKLIDALWPLLKPGGRLLYTTCTILPAENEEIISHFCHQHPDAQSLPIPIPINTGIPQQFGHQLFPAAQSHDGFYYALLAKRMSHFEKF